MTDVKKTTETSTKQAVSIWSSVELDCMSRGLSYKDYLHYHRASKTSGGVVTESQYDSLSKTLFSEESMTDVKPIAEEDVVMELAALAVILT